MLEPTLTAQLATHLQRLTLPIELAAALDDSQKSAQLAELLAEIAALSPLISVTTADSDPALSLDAAPTPEAGKPTGFFSRLFNKK